VKLQQTPSRSPLQKPFKEGADRENREKQDVIPHKTTGHPAQNGLSDRTKHRDIF